MKTIYCFLLAFLSCLGASAQSDSCRAALAAINTDYDQQLKALESYTKINAIDREYRVLMLGFYRNDRLFRAAATCDKGSSGTARNCLSQAEAINRTYNQQLADLRRRKMANQERMQRSDAINLERNAKLKELQGSCGGAS
ncbi:MAG: hypothetical protein EOO08_15280 [Chitinophagaceae bacterium]|nr:MAG: hypothetical protein EOO08_15280 [Chitinophagaceae bacterium]